jgi:hypothetical protein
MKKLLAEAIFILVAALCIHKSLAFALEGQIAIHDPSTAFMAIARPSLTTASPSGSLSTRGRTSCAPRLSTAEGPLTSAHGFSTLKTSR